MSEEEARDQTEEIINNKEPVKESVIETIIEEEEKPKSKAEAKSRAKPKHNKITKEPVEPVEPVESIIEEPIVDKKSRAKSNIKITKEPVVEEIEPVVEEPEQLKKMNILTQIVKCPDCNMDMTQHTLNYIHKRRGFCKADIKAEPEQTPEPEQQPKPKITEDIVNQYIKTMKLLVHILEMNDL